MDGLDQLAADAFRGLIVRKDLVRQFRGQFPVPTYVVEFMLGRYCATTDEEEIAEGLEIVRNQLSSRTVRAGEDELIKSWAKETGSARVIDIITARLDAKTDSYLATLPILRLNDVSLADEMVRENERMLTGGFYAEIDLGYDSTIAQEKGGRPFRVGAIRPIQLSTRGILEKIGEGRAKLTTVQWKDFLLRSVGLEPARLSQRAKDISLVRMVPFVERNYNMVELGPLGTGKSHLFQQVSPYAHLVSGGKATVEQAKRRQPADLLHRSANPPRQRLAPGPDRRTHALVLEAVSSILKLKGHGAPLTIHWTQARSHCSMTVNAVALSPQARAPRTIHRNLAPK